MTDDVLSLVQAATPAPVMARDRFGKRDFLKCTSRLAGIFL